MLTMTVITCIAACIAVGCAVLYMGLSIVWWLLAAIVKLGLFLVGALLTLGWWIIAPLVIVGILVLKLAVYAVLLAIAGTVVYAGWLAFRHRRPGASPGPSPGARRPGPRRFDMDSYLSRMEQRLRNLETIALRRAGNV